MSDARALLRAKRQEVRVSHPLAAYTSSGQLRCIACGTAVKQASAWEGHVGSKAHRVAVIRMREEEREKARQEDEERAGGKRRAESADTAQEDAEGEEDASREVTRGAKRMRLGESAGGGSDDNDNNDADPAATLSTTTKQKHANGGFPADFFSDPSKAPPAPLSDDEDEDEEMQQQDGTRPQTQPQAPAAPASAIDAEWAAFEQEVLNHSDERETYERATVFAEPELMDQTAGLPSATEEGAETHTKPELTEEELRQRKEQDERELIMDRLLDEEQAQEEADAKVAMLKNKLEALRKQRQARKTTQRKSKP